MSGTSCSSFYTGMENFEYRVKRLAKTGEAMSEDMFELCKSKDVHPESLHLEEGEVLVRLHACSVDPAFRAAMRETPLDKYMIQPYQVRLSSAR